MQTHQVKWKISLSNGETFHEGKGIFQEIVGELSPWQKLLGYMANGSFVITSLSLWTDDGRTFNLPSAGKNPKFVIFNQSENPVGYRMFRAYGREASIAQGQRMEKAGEDLFTVAEASYRDCLLQLWVDENDTRNCWTVVINKQNEAKSV